MHFAIHADDVQRAADFYQPRFQLAFVEL